MTERTIRKKLAKEGYRLISKTIPMRIGGYGKEKVYAIVDQNNIIVSGEQMTLEEIEKWVNS